MNLACRLQRGSLLLLFPIAWFAPLLHAGLLPIFGLSEISIISGLQSLWDTDPALALARYGMVNYMPHKLLRANDWTSTDYSVALYTPLGHAPLLMALLLKL